MSARAAIHAMFPLDEAATTELDARLDAHHTEALTEGARLIEDAACDADWNKPAGYCTGLRAGAELLLAKSVEKAGAPEATATPEFFQPGRTYAHDAYRFSCEYLVTHPTSGRRSAWGWFGKNGGWRHHSFSERQFQAREWTDVTEAGESRG